MTTVVIGLQALSGQGSGTQPIGGYFQIYPYAAEKLVGGGYLTLAKLGVTVVNGTASVVIPPTAAGEAVVFNPVNVPGMSQRIVAVPDSATPVLYEDLVDLDPSTLNPSAPLTPAWLVALQGWKLVQLADTGLADAVPGQAIVLGEDGKTWVPGSSGGGSGTVTNVSGGSANGFEVDVANETTTPQITMKVTFSGIAKGSGNALTAATAADIISTLGYTPAPASAIPANTDALPEGATNLYFTSARARSSVSLTAGSSGASYTPGTGVFDLSGVQAALGFTPENVANKGATNGYAPLVNGLVPSANLPAYVDEVQEYATLADFPATGAANIIYVAQDTELIYRWSGSTYIEINPSPGNTDAIPEGVVNLYFTTARAQVAQVQPDWNATSGKGQILNKPTIPAAQVQTDWNATSGLGVLLNKPAIPAAPVNADWNASSGLAQILNKPSIPLILKNTPNLGTSSTQGTILDTQTIPANTLKAGSQVRLRAWYTMTGTTTSKYSSVKVGSTQIILNGNAASSQQMQIDSYFTMINSTTLELPSLTNLSAPSLGATSAVATTVTIDPTQPLNIQFLGNLGASASDVITLVANLVEVFP